MSSFFKKLSKATPALTQGLVQGVKLRQDMDEAEFRRKNAARVAELQSRGLDIRNQELESAKNKAEQDEIKRLAEQYGSGIMVVDGQPQVNPAFTTPGTDLYNWSQRSAELKRSSPQASAPRMNWGQIYAQMGKPIPNGLDAGALVPDSVAARVLGASLAPGSRDTFLTADQINKLGKGELTGDIPVPSSYVNVIPKPGAGPKPPLGYRFTPQGSLEAIPGGPATREKISPAPPGQFICSASIWSYATARV